MLGLVKEGIFLWPTKFLRCSWNGISSYEKGEVVAVIGLLIFYLGGRLGKIRFVKCAVEGPEQ